MQASEMKTINRFVLGAAFLLLPLVGAKLAHSQASALDQYKQMGSLSAIATACYQSKAIPNKLSTLVNLSAQKNPEAKSALNALIAEYNTAYKTATTSHRLWNGTEQQYGERVFDCTNAEDMAVIKKFETVFLQNLAIGNT
jgi:hypothetical protein